MTVNGNKPIGVYNEWGRLREVLVGLHVNDTVPRWSPDWGRYHGTQHLIAGKEGKRALEVFPDDSPGTISQTENLASVLEQHGVVVHRPRLLSDEEIGCGTVGAAAQFARDPQVVIGKHVIETNLRSIYRNKEHLGYDRLFLERLAQDPEARHIRMPDVSPILEGKTDADFVRDPRPFLEGGDIFVMGKDILVGFSSLASSPAGVAWLQRYLAPEGYRVHIVPLTTKWLHLDCVFAVIREGLCICCTEGLVDGQLPEPIKDWEIIKATEEEAHKLGCNTLCLEPGVVVTGEEHGRLIAEIEKRKCEVVRVPFDKPPTFGGGIRCTTHPLLRDK